MLHTWAPPRALAPWLDSVVGVQLPPQRAGSHFPAMAQGMLVAHLGTGLGGASSPVLQLHTLSTAPTVHAHAGGVWAVGLVVQPAAMACLLDASTGLLVDRVLDWAEVAGAAEAARCADALAHRLHRGCPAHPTDPAAKALAAAAPVLLDSFQRTMARALAGRRAGRDAERARLCAAIGQAGGAAAQALGLGERQLQRRCHALLGLAPKRLHRLLRLQQVLSAALQAPARPVVQLAGEGGFYDQSHLARELRLLAGAALPQLLAGAQADGERWALAAHRQLRQAR